MIGGRWQLHVSGSRQLAWPGVVAATCVLLGGTRHLSRRYSISSALEFPVVFSLFTLIWCFAATSLLAGWTLYGRGRPGALSQVFLRVQPLAPIGVSVAAVVVRILLFSWSSQYSHCCLGGVYAFLPIAIAAVDIGFRRLLPRYGTYGTSSDRGPVDISVDETLESKQETTVDTARATGGLYTKYNVICLAYGFIGRQLVVFMERPVGSICPWHGRLNLLVPAGQVAVMALDAVVIVQAAGWRRRAAVSNTGSNLSWASLALLSLLSACASASIAIVVAISHPAGFSANLLHWAPTVEKLILHDLISDSAVAAATLVSAAALLGSVSPAAVAAVSVTAGILFQCVKQVGEEKDIVMLTGRAGWAAVLVGMGVVVLLFLLICSERGLRHMLNLSTNNGVARPWFAICYFGFAAALLLFLSSQRPAGGPTALPDVVSRGRASSRLWIKEARQSTSLSEAVAQYRRRYGMLPPPNFDKWYSFATTRNSPVLDIFDQIHDDLQPFWGIPPAVLRSHTTHLVEQTRAGFGGFSIRNHTIHLSPLTPGSHAWMMDGYRGMVEPFVEWLPDMDLAFNIDDESRVVVPFNDMQEYIEKGRQAQARAPVDSAKNLFSETLEPPWTAKHLEEGFKEAHADDPLTPFISFRHPVFSIYDSYIAPTCPPSSRALHQRWWSRKECLPIGRGVLEDVAASVDLCERPDIARMHGFLLDPAILGVSRALLPVFSQSRVSGYRDIIVPSPWNFQDKTKLEESVDRPWAAKLHSVFWRGSSTDGASRTGTWTSFLRARFAHMGRLASRHDSVSNVVGMVSGRSESTTSEPLLVNVSFVGEFYKGDPPDRYAQTADFYGKGGKPPAGLDFQEHWVHRHLIDLDGAAFSGRFIPFLESRSLPYRAALFRTWYEERVHAWQHYVPLDVSLSNLWGLVEQMNRPVDSSTGSAVEGAGGNKLGGASIGETIALDGQDWARKALRKEDMQIYMFRLLLEWARLIDDQRETLGFAAP